MEENQKILQKCFTYVAIVEEPVDILETLEFVEFVLEKKQMQGNFQEFENQVGKKQCTL